MTKHIPTGWVAPKDRYAVPVLFNPYTGEPRDVRDVQSDPQGILIVPPGKVEMLAAPVQQEQTVKETLTVPVADPVAWHRWYVEDGERGQEFSAYPRPGFRPLVQQDEVEKAYKEGRDWGAAERNRLNQIIQSDTIAKKQLLEALKGLLWYVGQLEVIVYEPSETDDHEAVAKARAAIAVVEGKV